MAKFCTQTRTHHVQNIYWVLYLKGSSLPKMTFSTKIPESESRPTDSQRQPRRGHRPRPLLLIALLLIAQVAYGAAGWLAACRAVTDLSGKQLVPYKYLTMYTRPFCLAVKQNRIFPKSECSWVSCIRRLFNTYSTTCTITFINLLRYITPTYVPTVTTKFHNYWLPTRGFLSTSPKRS